MDRIRPALSAEEWVQRRSGPISLATVGDRTRLVIIDADGQVVRVESPDEIFALIALANDALPYADVRKFTITDIAICRLVMERVVAAEGDARLTDLVAALCGKLQALLPVH
jgi:hypothetical protein